MSSFTITILLSLMFLVPPAISGNSKNKTLTKRLPCPYPESPINWIIGYCAHIAETDGEIAIENSKCFKDAEKDLKASDECAVKEKYKRSACEYVVKRKMIKANSTAECLKGNEVKPFIAGE